MKKASSLEKRRLLFKGVTAVASNSEAFIEREESEKGFAQYYDKNIRPQIVECELLRIESLKKWVLWSRISHVFFALAFLVSFFSESWTNSFSQALFCLLLFFFAKVPGLIVEGDYKENLLQKSDLLGNAIGFFPGFSLERNKRDFSRYHELDFISEYDEKLSKIRSSISGNYKGVKILFEDITLGRREVNLKKGEGISIVCDGWFIWIEFNKKFSGKTLIKPDSFIRADVFVRPNVFAGFDKSRSDGEGRNYQKVELEDVVFEDKFDVYSTDQIESRYLITTSFMERLKEVGISFAEIFLRQTNCPEKKIEKYVKYHSKCIYAFFHNNYLLITPNFSISSETEFSQKHSLFREVDLRESYRSVIKQINAVFKVIDALKLNEKIGL